MNTNNFDELLHYLRQAASFIEVFPKMEVRECIPRESLIQAADEIERLQGENNILRGVVGEENRANLMTPLYESLTEKIKELQWMLSHAVYCPSRICHICDLIEEEVRYDKS